MKLSLSLLFLVHTQGITTSFPKCCLGVLLFEVIMTTSQAGDLVTVKDRPRISQGLGDWIGVVRQIYNICHGWI